MFRRHTLKYPPENDVTARDDDVSSDDTVNMKAGDYGDNELIINR